MSTAAPSEASSSRTFSALSAARHPSSRSHVFPSASHAFAFPASAAVALVPSRSLSFWSRKAAEVPAEVEPVLDVTAVERIVEVAGTGSMDAATWPMIHAGSWVNTYSAELLLKGLHDATGLSWLAVVPIAVILMRTMLLPVFIEMQKATHCMTTSQPEMQDAMKRMAVRPLPCSLCPSPAV